MFYFPTRLSEEWSDEPSGTLLLHCATHAVQVARVWRQQRVHLLTAVSQCRSNQDAVQMKSVWRENQSLSLSRALKRAVFSGSDGPGHLFSTHMCRKWAFLPPALAYQSPLFISIKGLNSNFPAKQKSNIPLFVAFWRCICCPSAFLHKDTR